MSRSAALSLVFVVLATAASAQTAPKTAFDHQLTSNCPMKKDRYPNGTKRYSTSDLALNTVHVRYDAKELLSFKEIKAGKKPPLVTQAMLDARVVKALAEFDKVLGECQAEKDWTDEERNDIREYLIAYIGLSQVRFALFSPSEGDLFRQYGRMSQDEFQALADDKFAGSARHKAVIADLKSSDWYRDTKQYFSLDDPYYQTLIVDAYYSKLVNEVMHGRFDESARKRFPE